MCKEDMKAFEDRQKRVAEAHDELLRRLFGSVPENVGELTVTREGYIKTMKEIQKEYDLVEGSEDMILFVFEQLSRSPRFTSEGDSNNGKATE